MNEQPDDYGATSIRATGDGRYQNFLHVSGGRGNTDRPEIHLLISGDLGFAQGWYDLTEVRAAIEKAAEASR